MRRCRNWRKKGAQDVKTSVRRGEKTLLSEKKRLNVLARKLRLMRQSIMRSKMRRTKLRPNRRTTSIMVTKIILTRRLNRILPTIRKMAFHQ